jgi:hypothetical protein
MLERQKHYLFPRQKFIGEFEGRPIPASNELDLIEQLEKNGTNQNFAVLNFKDFDKDFIFNQLTNKLAENSSQKFLNLTASLKNLSSQKLDQFVRAVQDNHSIEAIDLSGIALDIDNLKILSKLIEKPNLKYLDLSDCKITAEGLKILVDTSKGSSTLLHLNLAGNNLVSSLGYLKELLEKNPNIQTIGLSNSNFDQDQIQILADIIKNHSLKNLELEKANLDFPESAELGEAIASSSLFSLDIYGSKLNSAFISSLSESLKHTQTLAMLNLGRTNIRETELGKLLEGLKYNNSLYYLGIEEYQEAKGRLLKHCYPFKFDHEVTSMLNEITPNNKVLGDLGELGETEQIEAEFVHQTKLNRLKITKVIDFVNQNFENLLYKVRNNEDINLRGFPSFDNLKDMITAVKFVSEFGKDYPTHNINYKPQTVLLIDKLYDILISSEEKPSNLTELFQRGFKSLAEDLAGGEVKYPIYYLSNCLSYTPLIEEISQETKNIILNDFGYTESGFEALAERLDSVAVHDTTGGDFPYDSSHYSDDLGNTTIVYFEPSSSNKTIMEIMGADGGISNMILD